MREPRLRDISCCLVIYRAIFNVKSSDIHPYRDMISAVGRRDIIP